MVAPMASSTPTKSSTSIPYPRVYIDKHVYMAPKLLEIMASNRIMPKEYISWL